MKYGKSGMKSGKGSGAAGSYGPKSRGTSHAGKVKTSSRSKTGPNKV